MLLTLWLFTDAVRSTSSEIQHEIKNARLHESFTLNCTYNCSSGFARGYWKWEETPVCSKCHWKVHKTSGDVCTVSIYTAHLIMEQTQYNYSCFSEENDKPGIPRKTELLVTLQVIGKMRLSLSFMMNNMNEFIPGLFSLYVHLCFK